MFFQRFLVLSTLLLLLGCQSDSTSSGRISIGVVSFDESALSIERYDKLKTYLGEQLNSLIELEPTYNERQALEQIERKTWDIVFAPPGLAAIAISQFQYTPLFPLESGLKTRSVIIVRQDSPVQNLKQLTGKSIAIGQPGSATGYYFPLYNLYGLTLKEVQVTATPRLILQAIAQKKADAGAMSLDEFNRYRIEFADVRFRILYTDTHEVPSGGVLISSDIEAKQRERIRKTLAEVSSSVAASSGYIANAPVSDYKYMIEVVKRVTPIAERIKQKPAPLYGVKP